MASLHPCYTCKCSTWPHCVHATCVSMCVLHNYFFMEACFFFSNVCGGIHVSVSVPPFILMWTTQICRNLEFYFVMGCKFFLTNKHVHSCCTCKFVLVWKTVLHMPHGLMCVHAVCAHVASVTRATWPHLQQCLTCK